MGNTVTALHSSLDRLQDLEVRVIVPTWKLLSVYKRRRRRRRRRSPSYMPLF
jgi:hypothetical protein